MFTKATLVDWDSDTDVNAIQSIIASKAEELKTQGKTDNLPEIIGQDVYKRVWLDQPAAEEWLAFVYAVSAEHSVPILSAEIINNA